MPSGVGPSAVSGILPDTEHVNAHGAYETSFSIAVPPAPGAPRISLDYDSQSNGSLAGIGWDLSAGYPMSIVRDVRFGTPAWKYGSNWLWGRTPLVRLNPLTCVSKCDYRTAPESLASVSIDLSPPPFPEGVQPQPPQERATVHLPNGTTLDYEPIHYDAQNYPAAPAGADTNVFGFRLAAVIDRNGYRMCLRYRTTQNPTQLAQQRRRGLVAPLVEIAYGTPPSKTVNDCAALLARVDRHSIRFEYQTLTDAGFYSTWSLRFGAPVTFGDYLTKVSVHPRLASRVQNEFVLVYYPSNTSDTRRPLLHEIVERVPGASPNAVASRVVKSFAYGRRETQFTQSQILDLGPSHSFPQALAGSVSRPIRRGSVLQNPLGIFEPGQDQDSDAAPLTSAITEQWAFLDLNGDGLLDLQWGRESGFRKDAAGKDLPWPTFEAGPPPFAATVTRGSRPAQQQILINHGILPAGAPPQLAVLATSAMQMSFSAPELEGSYFPRPTPRIEDGGPTPVRRETSWIWGEGRGLTRTGMPMAISAGEISNPSGECVPPRPSSQDPRHWPMYPDKTFSVPKLSLLDALRQTSLLTSGDNILAGTAFIGDVVKDIYRGYHPTFAVASTVSSWADMDGDGLPEFVATPGWIERFKFNLACATYGLNPAAGVPGLPHTQDAEIAHEPEAAVNAEGEPETRWFIHSPLLQDPANVSPDCSGVNLSARCLGGIPGPAGPVGLPISYDTSTGNTEGFGVTLPIGSIYSAALSAVMSQSWIPLAAAAPGITVSTFTPRGAGGLRIFVPGPSASDFVIGVGESVTGVLQSLGSPSASNAGSGVFGFVSTIAKVDLDLTLLSATTQNRSESRAQLMDINADGLPDYLLYSSGTNVATSSTACGPGTTSQGKLIAYLNSREGFGAPGNGPLIINCGFDYPAALRLTNADLDTIEMRVREVAALANELVSNVDIPGPEDPLCSGTEGTLFCSAYAALNPTPPDQLCKSQAILILSCIPYAVKVGLIADKAEQVVSLVRPFMAASRDEIDRERSLVNDVNGLKDFLRGFGLSIQAHPDLSSSVDATTTVARTVAENLAFVARSVRHIAHNSRINVITQGFSRLGGQSPTNTEDNLQPFWEAALGVTAQTKGFVDLNGDALPDYVLTADRDAAADAGFCPTGTWKVFWGTGTSAISSGTAFLTTPECIAVPAAPTAVTNYGYDTLPLNVDFVRREGTVGTDIHTQSHSFVTLLDFNRDGRPDIVIVGDEWEPDSTSQTWSVYLNNGSGFDLDVSHRLQVASPKAQALVAYCSHPDIIHACRDVPADVPYPSIRSTHTAVATTGQGARDRNLTEAAMLDIDGDGNVEMARRVHMPEPNFDWREGLLVWRRPDIGGPQDLMIEERNPIEGRRTRVEYRPAAHFQWIDATPNGVAPQPGHRNLSSVPGNLVRSVTTERLLGSTEQRTRRGYDYKFPHYDMATRSNTGFALRSTFPLDPLPEDPKNAQPIADTVVMAHRTAQRPNAIVGDTGIRLSVRSTGAPVGETLTSYAESTPTTSCPGAGSSRPDPAGQCPALGGIESVFSSSSRALTVDYPGNLRNGPVFELGFDGREPWVDRVRGRAPLAPDGACAPFSDFLSGAVRSGATAATGGAAAFTNPSLPVQCPAADDPTTFLTTALHYGAPHPMNAAGDAFAPVPAVAIETWIRPAAATATEQVILDQAGVYRLALVMQGASRRWQLSVGTGFTLTSSASRDVLEDRWQHVVATFGPTGARIFVNGRVVGSSDAAVSAVEPKGTLWVGCGVGANTTPERCFTGTLGELRVYPEYWSIAPRVSDAETELSLPNGCRFDGGGVCPHDFGQQRVVRKHYDLAVDDDDVATEYEYAAPASATGPRIAGLVSTEARWSLKEDGTPLQYLSFTAHAYDGRATGSATLGNETRIAQFDGEPTAQKPTPATLRVVTIKTYDTQCPGRLRQLIDPLNFVTETSWDATCSFEMSTTNALGQLSRQRYYGVEDQLPPLETVRRGAFGGFAMTGRYGQVAKFIDVNGAETVTTYDEWGRQLATWEPLDRVDRPGRRFAYQDAQCERYDHSDLVPEGELQFVQVYVPAPCHAFDLADLRLTAPSRVSTFIWDDQLRRCLDVRRGMVECFSSSALEFARESATGAYRVSHAFGDGQVQTQSVREEKPAWTVTGIVDFDALGRLSRSFKVQFLPTACPAGGTWCNSRKISGDPLRADVAALQIAYDAQNRVVRNYGPGWPRCASDPSSLACDNATVQVNDVTRLDYPIPGDTITTDGRNVTTLARRDVRGLVTLLQEYTRAPTTAPPGTAPTPHSSLTSTHDALGRLVSTRDQDNNVASSTFDALSRMTSSVEPDVGQTTYSYDRRSQLVARIVASGEKTTHEYDALGRVTQTDYLRPRQVTVPGTNGFQGTKPEDGEPWTPPELCYEIEGFEDPSRFVPGKGPPPSPPPFMTSLPVTEPEVALDLPFALSIGTTRAVPGGSDEAAQQLLRERFDIPAGTALSIRSDGSIHFAEGRGDLIVLGAPLLLQEGGLAYGIGGEAGARSFVIEWQGEPTGRPGERVRARLTLAEHSSVIRFDYIDLPREFNAKPGVNFRKGDLQFTMSGVAFEPHSHFVFGESGARVSLRLECGGGFPQDGIEIPMRARGVSQPLMQLRYRLFADCAAESGAQCGRPDLRIGYRTARDSETRPLTVARFEPRPLNQASAFDQALPDAADIRLPDFLGGEDFRLVVAPDDRGWANSHRKFFLDIVRGEVVNTVYDPEERVHRTYDSSEPPQYVDTRAGGARFATQPVFDVTFDVPGAPLDRSPSGALLTNTSCSAAFDAANAVVGASGRGVTLTSACDATIPQQRAPTLSQFTAALWIRPTCDPQLQTCAGQSVLSASQIFWLSLLADGRLRCSVGTSSIDSVDALPADAWTHVALSYGSDGLLHCAVNGVLQERQPVSASLGGPRTLSQLRIGQSTPAAPSIAIDEVRVVAASRSADELRADALRPLNVGPPRGNLVHIDFAHPALATGQRAAMTDQSKARNDATWVATSARIVAGIQGMAFDTRTMANAPPSPDAQIRIEHSSTLQLADAVTAELWVKTRFSQTGPVRLIGKWQDEAQPGWRLDLESRSGRLRWEVVTQVISQGASRTRRVVFITQETINDNVWHHIAATYDGQRLRVFRDGLPMHRWCGSGPREGVQPDNPDISNCLVPPPPAPCTVETREVGELLLPGQKRGPIIGDAECTEGTIDNTAPVLVASDSQSGVFDGFIDEIRVSNYAKLESDVAAAARLASAFTQSIGRETLLRNRFIWRNAQQVGPVWNDAPYDLAHQPASESRAMDLRGRTVSGIKRIAGQRSADDFFIARASPDSLGRDALLEYPHGEVLVNAFDVDGAQTRLIGYGPQIGTTPSQSQSYVASATATVTGRPAAQEYGNGIRSEWGYEDGPAAQAQASMPASFGPEQLRSARVLHSPTATPISDRTYSWDVVGNLENVRDAVTLFDATYTYDDLQRIASAKLAVPGQTGPLQLTYCYDALGNLVLMDGSGQATCQDATGNLSLDIADLTAGEGAIQRFGKSRFAAACSAVPTALPHALTQRELLFPGVSATQQDALCYDASGRLIWSIDSQNRRSRTYSYFARGKAAAISDWFNGAYVSEAFRFAYDGNGTRVRKSDPLGVQIQIGPAYREFSDAAPNSLPRFEALYQTATGAVARRALAYTAAGAPLTTEPDSLVWFSRDHLGSTSFLTDAAGTVVAGTRAYYRPFGSIIGPAASPAAQQKSGGRQFAFKTLDVSGLYDFDARSYDPVTGVFTQADEIVPGSDPSSRNRFSYAVNNPLRLIDDSGRAPNSPTLFDRFCAAVDWIDESLGIADPPTDFGVHPIGPVTLPPRPQIHLPEYVAPPGPMSQFDVDLAHAKFSVYAIGTGLVTYGEVAMVVTAPAQVMMLVPGAATRAGGLMFEELGSASLLDKGLALEFRASRAARFAAEDLHYVLLNEGERAFKMRATAVTRAYDPMAKEVVQVFTTYPRTSALQKQLADRMGIRFAPVVEGAHAEGSTFVYSRSAHLLPREGGVAGPSICDRQCKILIEDIMGGKVTHSHEFILPEFPTIP